MLSFILSAAALAGSCESRIVDYRNWREASDQQWSFATAAPAGGAVHLFGAQHLRDPAADQFASIAGEFAAAKPTLAFFEGPDRGLAATAEAAIREQGESGYLRWLAAHAGVPTRSLEPSPPELLSGLKESFDGDRLMLFFVLREVARMRDREQLGGVALDAAVTTLLAKASPMAAKTGVTTSIVDLETLARASRAEWPNRDWRDLPSNWFSPLGAAEEAKFLPEINRAVSQLRNVHMARLFATEATKGERLFVVVGRNHVPMIAPALECALAQPAAALAAAAK